jgi:hypothetical protein
MKPAQLRLQEEGRKMNQMNIFTKLILQIAENMKNRVIIIVLSVAVLAVVLFFQLRGDKKTGNLAPGVHQVKAEEVLQTNSYTYVRVSEGRQDYWCAINKSNIEVGKTYYWLKGGEMIQFHSKELDRVFDRIFFVETLSETPILEENPIMKGSSTGRQIVAEKQGLTVDRAEGGITIGELFANRKTYAGKSVKIRGEVVKYSPHIMNRNWVHVQDGTKDGSDYDLVVTTQDSIHVGETRIFEGIISLDVDFGSGYTYDVIMHDARAN